MVEHTYQELAERLSLLRKGLEKSIVGQPKAVDAIMGALERYHAGLHDDKRPIGSFLFIGPTGSGKTHTVETLAEMLFGRDDKGQIPAYIRLDCSEFSLEQDIAKIFGAAPGYIGSDAPSMLTKAYNAIPDRDKGFILLLDEVEKANRKFFDTWLQVLSAGHLTDSKGNRLDFSRCLMFMTSNVGAEHHQAQSDVGFRPATARETQLRTEAQVNAALKRQFKPEFLNRIDGVIHFNPLTIDQQDMILGNLLHELNNRLARHYLHVELAPTLRGKIIEKGFSKEYGARELRRTLTTMVEQPLARKIIRRDVHEDSLLELGMHDDGELSALRIGDYPILMEENISL